MEKIKLVIPVPEHKEQALLYRKEHFDMGERELHGASLLDQKEQYEDWLALLAANRAGGVPGWVPATTFFAVRETDGRIVGTVDVRHTLNGFLRKYGGNIGYGVRPSERRKGYAKQMLALALEYCRSLGLERVILTCYQDNEASRRTIQALGGQLEREYVHTDGKTIQIFWIEGGLGV